MATRHMEVIPAIDVLGDASRAPRAGRLRPRDAVRRARRARAQLRGRRAPRGSTSSTSTARARAGSGRTSSRRSSQAAAPVPVQASGGIRSVADAEALLAAGADRVVVGTAAWTLLDELVAALGERLVVALDVRDGVVRTRGWTEGSLAGRRGDPTAASRRACRGSSARRSTATARCTGPDLELVAPRRRRARACPCSPPAASAPTRTRRRSLGPARRARSSVAPSSRES